jgi:threonine/homoserine/homoserine lactone efflux protein
MTLASLAPFIFACLVMELTPGPNMAYLTLLSAQRGKAAGYWATAGVLIGLLGIGFLSLIGVSTLVASNALIYEVIRWAGVLYLVWLAYDTLIETQAATPAPRQDVLLRESFMRGLITNLLNPKAFAFYATVLPAFVAPESAYLVNGLILTLIYVAIATAIHIVIVTAAGSISRFLDFNAGRLWLGRSFAGLLLFVAIWLAFKTAR